MTDPNFEAIPREHANGTFSHWEVYGDPDLEIEGRGKTIAEAFEDFQRKTGIVIDPDDVQYLNHDPAQTPDARRMRASLTRN